MAKKKPPERFPITMRGQPAPVDSVKLFMEEWSRKQAEANHVETIEEANDFEIYDEEDDDLFTNYTVYEMHEMAEENLKLLDELPQSDALTPEPGHAASEVEEAEPNNPPAGEPGGRGSGGTEGVPPGAEGLAS